ncbi:folate-binding protein [Bradyrhizobium sp. LHD-71]|uniref:CAF17-like 4Fe-4S cluster assembly/insertion protein YgfZ n=1 Tax=Bradyrhizobium sp. LHD-71 TaxID=3072141 RepID=UPI00281060B0|nr:folate-binding protein [Bradyrhizobium sp. LHD-71]MDQ8731477.1 folate-binding protein [Bradyrhizobium sp. LHD-71]
MKAAFLPDRGVVKIGGDDARQFLNNLVTAELAEVKPGTARFAALLTPQGKIVADFLVTEAPAAQGGGFLIDCPKPLADQLATKLNFYKLRAKVTVENLTGKFGVLAAWDGRPATMPDLAFADPRNGELGYRIVVPDGQSADVAQAIGAELVAPDMYEVHRIVCGVPNGGTDFIYGDAFPHEANMDRLHGVDFDKGCYVGQEVVSRMQHRGTARTRTVRVVLDGPPPEAGSDVIADGKSVGTMGSSRAGRGLALLRLDKVSSALAGGVSLSAGGIGLKLVDPADAKLPEKQVAP